jgi:hypothetical protein
MFVLLCEDSQPNEQEQCGQYLFHKLESISSNCKYTKKQKQDKAFALLFSYLFNDYFFDVGARQKR